MADAAQPQDGAACGQDTRYVERLVATAHEFRWTRATAPGGVGTAAACTVDVVRWRFLLEVTPRVGGGSRAQTVRVLGADRACLVGVRASWLVMSVLVSCRSAQSGTPE